MPLAQEIPIEAWRALEQQIQDLRLRVLSEAEQFASPSSETRKIKVTPRDIEAALEAFVSPGSTFPPEPNPLTAEVPQDSYLFLEGRLNKLRRHILSLAFSMDEKSVRRAVELAWNSVKGDRQTLSELLVDRELSAT